MKNVLILCIGNICRSPMAEGLLKKELADLNVQSAGLGALVGHPADPFSVQIMSEQGVDISAHRAQQISSKLIAEADLILVMDKEQKKFVEGRFARSRGKVFRLCERDNVDIPDPYRGEIQKFRDSNRLIVVGVAFWRDQILQLNQSV
jgi:protein-tyrosine phosphatase